MTIALAPPRVAHRFALLVFSTFACVAAWAWWTQTDCGCFGQATPKGIPLLVDVIAIALLMACMRQVTGAGEQVIPTPRRRYLRFLGVAGVAGLLATATTGWHITRLDAHDEMPAWFGENLIGKPFPLLRDERFAAIVSDPGDTLVVMLRPDCDHCVELAEQWRETEPAIQAETQVIGLSASDARWTVMPRNVSAHPARNGSEFAVVWEDTGESFVATPTFIAIRNGIAVNVVSGNETPEPTGDIKWLKRLFSK